MRAADFHHHFRALGEELLTPSGYLYKARAWHLSTADQQLSFCPEDSKFGIHFAVKYLTVALFHRAAEVPSVFHFAPLKNNSRICPVCISPATLKPFVTQQFDLRVWDCPPAGRSPLKVHQPLYFGGLDHWILPADRATAEDNRAALLTFLRQDGVTDLSEEHALATLRAAFESVAAYARTWAEHLTIPEAYRLMLRHAVDGTSFLHDAWLPAYARAVQRVT